MGVEEVEFFVDIGLLGYEGHFLFEPLGVKFRFRVGESLAKCIPLAA